MLRAVIFDFDGVIADDERLHLEGFRHALAAHGIEISEAQYFSRYLGYDDRDGFKAMLRDAGRRPDDTVLEELIRQKHEAFRRLVGERVRIYPGVHDLLADLRRAPAPVATAIGSGALRGEIELILDLAGLRSSFDRIVSAEDVKRGKPDPETFATACASLAAVAPGLTADECLVIEDSTAGLSAAAAAGMKTVAVCNSYSARELQADLVIDSLEHLDRARCASLWAT